MLYDSRRSARKRMKEVIMDTACTTFRIRCLRFVLVLPVLIICSSCFLEPGVHITSPETDAVFEEGATVKCTVSVSAATDKVSELIWTSSHDGEIHTAAFDSPSSMAKTSFTTSSLSRGRHFIYCAAYGVSDFIGLDGVSITIGGPSDNDSLYVLLAYPRQGAVFDQGASITFAGAAGDPEQGELTGEALLWTSNRDGSIGTGATFATDGLSAGEHLITFTATTSSGATRSRSVTITVTASETPDSSTSTTTTAGGSVTTTSAAGVSSSTTTSAATASSTSTAPSAASTTTSLDRDFDCPTEEPIGCIDPAYSTEQYWCCEEETVCGPAELDPADNQYYGTCLPVESTTTSSAPGTTTTTQAAPDKTTLYMSPDASSDLLFYVAHPDGTTFYYHGTQTGGALHLTHVTDDDGTTIIFNDDFNPAQWIAENLTVLAYTLNDDPFDPHSAYHEIFNTQGKSSLTVDIYPSSLQSIVTSMEAASGQDLSSATAFLSTYSIGSFSDLVTRAQQSGADQARFIAAAAGFGAAAGYLALDAQNAFSSKTRFISACGLYDPLVQFVAGMLGSAINDAYGPQPPTDPNEPSVQVLLCRGATTNSHICHYLFFMPPPGTAGMCVPLCLTSMRCFTDICMPKVLSAASAAAASDNYFYN